MAYRMALWAGLATNLFFGLLRAMLLIALYGTTTEVNGLTLTGAITYVGLTQSLIMFLSLFVPNDMADSIYSGAVGADLLKPAPFYVIWLGRDFGKSLVNLFGRGVLFMLIYALFFQVTIPSRLETWLALTASLLLAWLISFSWRYLVSLSAFWTPDARGILRITGTLFQLLSGFIMPLRLLPDWFSTLAQYTPFPAMVNNPVEIYLGTMQGVQVWNVLWFQAIWVVVLIGISSVVFRAGIRRLVIQGG